MIEKKRSDQHLIDDGVASRHCVQSAVHLYLLFTRCHNEFLDPCKMVSLLTSVSATRILHVRN